MAAVSQLAVLAVGGTFTAVLPAACKLLSWLRRDQELGIWNAGLFGSSPHLQLCNVDMQYLSLRLCQST
jgi:hypothetical protein